MKKIFILAILALSFASCSKKNVEPQTLSDRLAGTWIVTHVDYAPIDKGRSSSFTFTKKTTNSVNTRLTIDGKGFDFGTTTLEESGSDIDLYDVNGDYLGTVDGTELTYMLGSGKDMVVLSAKKK
jgi:hypothetical protein